MKKTDLEKKIDEAKKLLEKHGYVITPPLEPIIIDDSELKRRKLKEREKKLIDMMMPYKSLYSADELNSFYSFWSEPNKSLTKLRYELQPTWDVKRRLATWHRKTTERISNGRQQTTNEERISKLADILTGQY